MELQSIKLAGFKSFVDATTIPFRSHLNAIVGPNGCGKSNIVDAVRWVTGETSAKQLRGQSMADVIFNGTTSRQPVGKASIELTFSNTEGQLTGEYAKFSQIAIKREVTRDGQSNYYLNGASCRRKDIIDVFLGTGLGPRSYAIIEQGMVSRLIEAKPEEMRAHLEEAAGISKYKERRRETENRIRRTQENIDRLNDLREELDKQLRHLKRQSRAAERYKEYRQEHRVLVAQIKALQWQKLDAELKQHDELIEVQTNQREEHLAEQRGVEVELEKGRVVQTELTEQHNDVQKRYYTLGAEIARVEQQIHDFQEQATRWQTELDETNTLWQELTDNSTEYKAQIESISEELDALTPQSGEIVEKAEQAANELRSADEAMREWESNWETFQSEYASLTQRIEVSRTNIQHYEQQLQRIDQRLARLQEADERSDLTSLQEELTPLNENVARLEAELARVNEVLQSTKHSIDLQRQNNTQRNQTLRAERETLQQQQAKLAALEALQQNALDSSDEQIQSWLEHHDLKQRPRLGKTLRVNAGWEQAVESVLRHCFDAVCVDSVNDYLRDFSQLERGSLTLIDRERSHTAMASRATLASQVESEWPLEAWLNGIYIADSLEEAQRMRAQLNANESVITREGIWLGLNWMRVAKPNETGDSVLLREQEIARLQTSIAEKESHVQGLAEELQQGEERLAELESQRDAEHQTYQRCSGELTQVRADTSAKQSRLDELTQQAERVERERQDNRNQAEQLGRDLQQVRDELAEATAKIQEYQQRRSELQRERDQRQSHLQRTREHAQREQQKADEFELRVAANQSQLDLLQKTASREARQIEQLGERREQLQSRLAENDGPMQALQSELQEELNKRVTIERELREAEGRLQSHVQEQEARERNRNAIMRKLSELQMEMQELQVQREAFTVRQTTIVEQISETDQNLQQIIEEMPEEADLSVWEENSAKLENRINRLGPINLAAIDEYSTVNERKEYLDKQEADLAEALSILQDAIRKIDRETRSRFKETFEKVNKEFRELFPKIFGGGQAYMELTDEDLLAAGVVVKAQPPGKRNTTIHMLSGGEKALTAIALVFAMFALTPAPFCVLDEVDAPLDDLNVGRFCQLVKAMSKTTQFIVISHNKVTIEQADNLMGITMQEPGVSRVVAVDMDEAISMVETVAA